MPRPQRKGGDPRTCMLAITRYGGTMPKRKAAAEGADPIAEEAEQASMPDAGIIDALKEDNRKIEELFTSYEASSGSDKAELVKQIASNLTILAVLREEIVYPALKEG